MINIKAFPMVSKPLQGLLWVGKAQHDKQTKQTNNLPQ
jgi:hypothetical protein